MHITKSQITKAIAAATMSMAVAAPAQAQASNCANTAIVPSAANTSQVRQATLCLVNEERTSRGLPKLKINSTMTRLAQSYAERMAREHFFSHTAPDGSTQTTRLQKTGYFKNARSWYVGENIFEAPTGSDTPAAIVDNWMHSAGHRANILNRKLRDAGMGHVLVLPTGGAGTTAVLMFGGR